MRKILLLLIPSVAFADCNISEALQNLRPGAQWTCNGNIYAGIQWLDQTQTKPSQTEVTNWLSTCTVTTDGMVLSDARSSALAQVNGGFGNAELQRAILLTILDQLNTIRAALPTPLSAITPAQARTAVQNKLNSGAAD
jgi:hypothetical protein